MEIRELKPEDAEDYFAIRLDALKNNPEAFASSYEEEKNQTANKYKERFQTSEKSITFGAFDGIQLVGVITLVKEQLLKLRHRANIVAMYVNAEKRNEGIGKSLLTEVIQQANYSEDIEQLYLTVVTTNEPAKILYSSTGFKVFGKEKRALKVESTYYDEEHMVLFL